MEHKRRGALKAARSRAQEEDRRKAESDATERSRAMLERLAGAKVAHAVRSALNVHRALWLQSARILAQERARREWELLQHQPPPPSSAEIGGSAEEPILEEAVGIAESLRAASALPQPLPPTLLEKLRNFRSANERAASELSRQVLSLEREISELLLTTSSSTTMMPTTAFGEHEEATSSATARLQESLAAQLEELDDLRVADFEELRSELDAVEGSLAAKTWNAEDLERIECTTRCYAKLQKPRALVLERLGLDFPSRSASEIAEENDLLGRRKALQRSLRALEEQWRRERAQLVSEGTKLLEAARDSERLQSIRVQQRAASAERLQAMHAKLDVMRERKQKEEDERRLLEERTREEEQRERESVAEIRKRELAAKKAMALARQEESKAEKAVAAAEQRRRAEEQHAKALKRVAETKQTVEARQRRHAELAERRKQEQTARQEAERAHKMQVEKAAQALAPSVSGDADRLQQPTTSAAVRAAMQTQRRRKRDESLHANQSYSEDTILGDARTRITEALRTAGLLGTDYAQECLLSMAHPRPDAMTSDERAQIKLQFC